MTSSQTDRRPGAAATHAANATAAKAAAQHVAKGAAGSEPDNGAPEPEFEATFQNAMIPAPIPVRFLDEHGQRVDPITDDYTPPTTTCWSRRTGGWSSAGASTSRPRR